ncbi:MAG TPA: carboxylate-amine ligase [Planctomycetota bacterium]|nr:carboxylate-amine ligase [Planctomycetota bacterium]
MSQDPAFSIGIEEEFQVVDPVTRELRSHVEEIFDAGRKLLKERIKPELHQSVVEIATGICPDIRAARQDVAATRAAIVRLAREQGLAIAAAGTHPFSHWADVSITPNPRYEQLIQDFQTVARANLIFGLHVHVGVEDRELAIGIMNEARYFLPHVLALSVNSPFWLGRETGWMSYRTKVFDKFPRTNIPDEFGSFGDFEDLVTMLLKTHCIADAKQIWWDVRPHPHFPTLEYRICDIPMRFDETITLAALLQAITVKLYRIRRKNLGWRTYRRELLMENKWRAARWGVAGKLIDFGKAEEFPTPLLIEELLEFVDDVVDDLGSREEVNRVRWILENGTGADRQLRVWRETRDLKKVVDFVASETAVGLPV